MVEITHNNIPEAVAEILEIVLKLERQLAERISNPNEDKWFDLPELCNYLPDKPIDTTVYKWISKNAIPFYQGTKKHSFLKSEIDDWLKSRRQNAIQIMENREKIDVSDFMIKNKKRNTNAKR